MVLKSRRGFTLIELLSVIVILGILLTLGVISVTKIIYKSKDKMYVKQALMMIDTAKKHFVLNDTGNDVKSVSILELLGDDSSSPYGKYIAGMVVADCRSSCKYYIFAIDNTNRFIGKKHDDLYYAIEEKMLSESNFSIGKIEENIENIISLINTSLYLFTTDNSGKVIDTLYSKGSEVDDISDSIITGNASIKNNVFNHGAYYNIKLKSKYKSLTDTNVTMHEDIYKAHLIAEYEDKVKLVFSYDSSMKYKSANGILSNFEEHNKIISIRMLALEDLASDINHCTTDDIYNNINSNTDDCIKISEFVLNKYRIGYKYGDQPSANPLTWISDGKNCKADGTLIEGTKECLVINKNDFKFSGSGVGTMTSPANRINFVVIIDKETFLGG